VRASQLAAVVAHLVEPCSGDVLPDSRQVGRILTVHRHMSTEASGKAHRIRGRLWYELEAQEIVSAVPKLDPVRAILCAAVLSPQINWERVPALLALLPVGSPLAVRRMSEKETGNPGAVLNRSWAAALGILKATKSAEMVEAIGRGPKVRSFALNLLEAHPGIEVRRSPGVVTIDSHAAQIAGASPASLRGKAYGRLAASYVLAAQIIWETPAGLQAMVWEHWRSMPWKDREGIVFG
jgi:hypothetical protein